MNNHESYDAVALLSGGLDSILAARLVQDQGLRVKCLHFVSPFFGKVQSLGRWEKLYGLDILPVDIGDDFAALLAAWPEHDFGKVLNPCVDCKILMLRRAKAIMEECGARFIVSGEVLGQRPMSQRRDTLNIIRREAGVRDLLLRPLSALVLDETPMERDGLVDRSLLGGIHGRGRKDQLALASRLGFSEIPTPGGGCRLAEKENARSYWPVLRLTERPCAADFALANTGRQYWSLENGPLWLAVGRNQADNDALAALAGPGDIVLKTELFPGPLAVGRAFGGRAWDDEILRAAASFTASFSPKAARHAAESGTGVAVRERSAGKLLSVQPDRVTACNWREYSWDAAKAEIRAIRREREGRGLLEKQLLEK